MWCLVFLGLFCLSIKPWINSDITTSFSPSVGRSVITGVFVANGTCVNILRNSFTEVIEVANFQKMSHRVSFFDIAFNPLA